jgi:hypothetical protein
MGVDETERLSEIATKTTSEKEKLMLTENTIERDFLSTRLQRLRE